MKGYSGPGCCFVEPIGLFAKCAKPPIDATKILHAYSLMHLAVLPSSQRQLAVHIQSND